MPASTPGSNYTSGNANAKGRIGTSPHPGHDPRKPVPAGRPPLEGRALTGKEALGVGRETGEVATARQEPSLP